MTINGIPLHPLLVHGAVVFVPLTAVLTVLLFVKRIRPAMTQAAAVSGILALAFTVIAKETGEQLLEAMGKTLTLERHAELADALVPLSLSAAVLLAGLALLTLRRPAFAARWAQVLSTRTWVLPTVRGVALAAAVAALVQVVLVGDTGAQAVWLE